MDDGRVPIEQIQLNGWDGAGTKKVYRRGHTVHRQTGSWAAAVHSLLRHFEAIGFDGAPRLVGSGSDPDGLETVTFIEGEFRHPGPWTLEGACSVVSLLHRAHDAVASFKPASDVLWKPWFGRDLGRSVHVIGHCDAGPWNIVARDGLAVAHIDWDFAGPVDPLVDSLRLAGLTPSFIPKTSPGARGCRRWMSGHVIFEPYWKAMNCLPGFGAAS